MYAKVWRLLYKAFWHDLPQGRKGSTFLNQFFDIFLSLGCPVCPDEVTTTAQQVQQVLLPEQIAIVPGFTMEAVYQPGGRRLLPDFAHGRWRVAGGGCDVAGKGLPAAMLVSVLVGATRGIAMYTRDPAELLANLNGRLIGRTQGSFSTAVAACIDADGRVTVANAGHLSPYLDGNEVGLADALPLGVISGAAYETREFASLRLTFYSDGVVEAQNQEGELFGFERAQEISTQPAAAIGEAAQSLGRRTTSPW